MDILKTYTKNKLRLLMNQPNWINADCEDKSLILQEKKYNGLKFWKEHSQDFDLTSKEFRVFSQSGDEEIIQYLAQGVVH